MRAFLYFLVYVSFHCFSVRFQERKRQEPIKKIAYLVDLQTINILDVTTSTTLAAINHDSKIDWLELSQKADKLLFRDKRRQLHLFDVASQTRSTLLHYCSYVQVRSHIECFRDILT
jgi:intraflagellar transport protein 172